MTADANYPCAIAVKTNRGRLAALMQEAHARIRRAPRGTRSAMIERYARRAVRECVRVKIC